MGGPGETQIEADRRILQDKIVKLERELEQVRRTRQLHRANARRCRIRLWRWSAIRTPASRRCSTGSPVRRSRRRHAVCDARSDAAPYEACRRAHVILSDTVGFISDLPTHLVAAFRATLEEVLEADLILHVRDMSDPDNAAQAGDVMRILTDLGIEGQEAEDRILEVWNKIDRLEPEAHEAIADKAAAMPNVRAISAVTGEGVDALLEEVSRRISGVMTMTTIDISPANLSLLPWLYANAIVDERHDQEDGSVSLDIRISEAGASELERKLGTVKSKKDEW